MGALRPTRDEALMLSAMVWARRGTCSRAQVGAVIARDGRILSTGYNGAPAGFAHCDHSCNCGTQLRAAQDPPLAHYDICKSIQPCVTAIHAEANAIVYAARYGIRTEGAELFSTTTPCPSCARLIVNAGIVRVVSQIEYRDPEGWNILDRAGVDTMILNVVE